MLKFLSVLLLNISIFAQTFNFNNSTVYLENKTFEAKNNINFFIYLKDIKIQKQKNINELRYNIIWNKLEHSKKGTLLYGKIFLKKEGEIFINFNLGEWLVPKISIEVRNNKKFYNLYYIIFLIPIFFIRWSLVYIFLKPKITKKDLLKIRSYLKNTNCINNIDKYIFYNKAHTIKKLNIFNIIGIKKFIKI